MPLNITSLVSQRDALVTLMGTLTSSPKPTYTVEGRTYQWTQYMAELRAQLVSLNQLIDLSEGPVELHTEGF